MEATLIGLLVIVVVVMVALYLLGKLGLDAQLTRIAQLVIVGVALIIVIVRYLLPLL